MKSYGSDGTTNEAKGTQQLYTEVKEYPCVFCIATLVIITMGKDGVQDLCSSLYEKKDG